MNNCIEFLTTWYMSSVLKYKILQFKAFINAYMDEIIIIHGSDNLKAWTHDTHIKYSLSNGIMINFLEW